jgi:hypothetical protein
MSIVILLGGVLNHVVQRRVFGIEQREAEIASKAPDTTSRESGAESGGERQGSKVETGARVATAGVLAVGTRVFSRWRRRKTSG